MIAPYVKVVRPEGDRQPRQRAVGAGHPHAQTTSHRIASSSTPPDAARNHGIAR